jgi:hypothetical protein
MRKKFNLANLNASTSLRNKNKAYLDLQSVIGRSRAGFLSEQARLKSKPARASAAQLLRQLDLIFNMVQMPHILLATMEGYANGFQAVLRVALGEEPEYVKRQFDDSARDTMRKFFLLDGDYSGGLSRPWLFAVTVYIWTAFECLASDLWASSLNDAT